jgi:hypothetical protein
MTTQRERSMMRREKMKLRLFYKGHSKQPQHGNNREEGRREEPNRETTRKEAAWNKPVSNWNNSTGIPKCFLNRNRRPEMK